MSKKKKTDTEDEDRVAPAPKVGTSMKGLLASVKLGAKKQAEPAKTPPAKAPPRVPPQPMPAPKPAPTSRPSDGLVGHARTAYFDAMAGVRSLDRKKDAPPPRATAIKLPPAPPSPIERESDREARAKLASLVSGGLHFEIRHEDDWHAGIRRDAPRGTLENLADATPHDDATLDLHGAREADVEPRLAKFLRRAYEQGLRRVRVVHGKGLHSPGGPVLGDAVIDALTKGAPAARVLAFVTAPESQGGAGALLVQLIR